LPSSPKLQERRSVELSWLSLHYRVIPFAFYPNFAVYEVFLLPYRHQLLQAVDALERCVERGPAMRRRHNHGNTGLTDLETPEPVNHGYASNGVAARNFSPNFRHHFHRHPLVAFVFEKASRPALGVVACYAFEVDKSAIFAAEKLSRDGRSVYRIARQGKKITRCIGYPVSVARPSAHRRQQGYFIAIRKRCRRGRKLLIQRQHSARPRLAKPGKTPGIVLKNGTQASAVGNFKRVLAEAYHVTNYPKKQHSYTH